MSKEEVERMLEAVNKIRDHDEPIKPIPVEENLNLKSLEPVSEEEVKESGLIKL